MNRKEFFRGSLALGACAGCFLISTPATANSPETISEENEKYKALLQEKELSRIGFQI